MGASFDLAVTADAATLTATLRLRDAAGTRLGERLLTAGAAAASRWEGLFELRRYVRRYAGYQQPAASGAPLDEEALVREIGVFLGHEVLGEDLVRRLTAGPGPRTLRVHVSGEKDDPLAAAFARVPWEIARLSVSDPTLAEKGVLVRTLAGEEEARPERMELRPDESLRILLVFADAAASRPLAARLEREKLLDLMRRRVYTRRRVEVDVLAGGVTRERLASQLARGGGYHVVHWSGHGSLGELELFSEGDEPGCLTGEGLCELMGAAGGLPRLVFLSACRSGTAGGVHGRAAFQAVVEGRDAEDGGAAAPAAASGCTGVAQQLLRAGVATVVAMRYEVGDDYARDLAVAFYERLLGGDEPCGAESALHEARRELLAAGGYHPCDHATPVLFGAADPGLPVARGRTEPRTVHPPLKVPELRPHADFIGRTWELARLGARWLEASGERPVAVLRGLGGLGKTALAAESIELWHERFHLVFAFQAKPVALQLDDFLRRLHVIWLEQQGPYSERVRSHPAEAVWRAASDGFEGQARDEAMRRSLVSAMGAEPVLLVLDNLESCLVSPSAGGAPASCQEPAWEALLRALARGLRGTRSRLLVTSRWPLAALSDPALTEDLALGPLPPQEAALYVRGHEALRRLYGEGDAGRALIDRLLQVSRGHPLLLDRLGRLAQRDRSGLEQALAALSTGGLGAVGDFFDADGADPTERAYLEDALVKSIDLLLERAGMEARRLLWVLSLANEPATVALWRDVWSGRSLEEQQLAELIDAIASLPPEARDGLPPLSRLEAQLAEVRAREPVRGEAPEMEPLRRSLVTMGLVSEQPTVDDANPVCACHELVRERIAAWMRERPGETLGRSEKDIWIAYGERLVSLHADLVKGDRLADAIEEGARALRYVARAGDFEAFEEFVGGLVSSTTDPGVLRPLLPDLERAAAAAPPDRRRRARRFLADALRNAGQAEASLAGYEAAAGEAREAGDGAELAAITAGWASALFDCGELEAARVKLVEAAALKERAGAPEVERVACELETLHIDVLQGEAAAVLPALEARLARLKRWWERVRGGEAVSEAPDAEALARVYISALDIRRKAFMALKRWASALAAVDEIIAVADSRGASPHLIASYRFKRYGPLLRLGEPGAAQRELEACLPVFESAGDDPGRARILSALADVFDTRGDAEQAARLERRALAIRECIRDPEGRGVSHGNLAGYLGRSGHGESAYAHELAAIVYKLHAGYRQALALAAYNLVARIVGARRAGGEHRLPRVAELIALPEFAGLRAWLEAQRVDVARLQEDVDALVARCDEEATRRLARPARS